MRMEVWNEPTETEPVLRLRLVKQDDARGVALCAVDENGYGARGGLILIIGPAGIYRYTDVDEALGLPRDEKGRAKLVGGEQ